MKCPNPDKFQTVVKELKIFEEKWEDNLKFSESFRCTSDQLLRKMGVISQLKQILLPKKERNGKFNFGRFVFLKTLF